MVWVFLYWILWFWISLVCSGIQLNYIFAHEDLDEGFQEPYEISEALFKYIPIEIILQWWLTGLSVLFYEPLWFWYFVVMTYLNIKYWRKKQLTQHFLTDQEYSKREGIERVIKYKLIYYLIIVFFSLVLSIIKLAELIAKGWSFKRTSSK